MAYGLNEESAFLKEYYISDVTAAPRAYSSAHCDSKTIAGLPIIAMRRRYPLLKDYFCGGGGIFISINFGISLLSSAAPFKSVKAVRSGVGADR